MADDNDLHRIGKELMESQEFDFSSDEASFLASLRHKELEAEMAQAISALYSVKSLERALKRHADALTESAEASEKHASSLKWATWALVGATLMLGLVAFLQLLLCSPL